MPIDRHPREKTAAEASRVRRKGLRIALAVSVGFTWFVATGAIIPFLGPLFAAQFLIGSSRPLPLAKAVGMVVLVLAVGAVLHLVTSATGNRPLVFLPLLGLFYFACFHAQARGKGGPAVFLMLVIGIMLPLLTILNRDLGASVLAILVQGIVGGILLMGLAHVLIPDEGGVDPRPPVLVVHPRPVRRALADTAILLLIVAVCLTDPRLATAIVIPITVASLLTQLDASAGARAALGLVLVNLIGGVAASLAFVALQVRPSLLTMFLLVLVAGLVFGGKAAGPSPAAKLYAGTLTTFLLVFGAGVSPLPGSAAESFSTRIGYILVASAYAVIMTALLWPRRAPARTARLSTL